MIYGCLVNLSPPERPSPKRNSRRSLWRWITSMLRRWNLAPIQHVWWTRGNGWPTSP